MQNNTLRNGMLVIVTCFGAVYVMSQFFRASNAVIAKPLTQTFGLSPESLGVLTGVFFFGFAAAQIPVGMLFDRFGASRTVSIMLGIAVAGSIVFGLADGLAMLILGRVMMGIGVSGVLMGALHLFGRWASPDRYGTWMGRMIALGGVGVLLSTTPLALVTEAAGWRVAFFGTAGITAVGAAFLFALVRDAPPGHPAETRTPETLRENLRGMVAVAKHPRLPPIFGMALASYPVVITVLGLWGGPYLVDVHGLAMVTSGNLLLTMALAVIVANLAVGPLERMLDTRKWLVVGAVCLMTLALVLLAVVPGLALWQVGVLFGVVGACGSFNVVVAGHGRSLFPDRLAGRGMSLIAIGLMGGPALLQSVSGLIIGAFDAAAGAPPEAAYRAMFGFLALVMIAALVFYIRLPDARPSAGFSTDD